MSRILVTGGSGFVGRSLIRILGENHYLTRATYRDHIPVADRQNDIEWIKYSLEDEDIIYSELLDGVETVIHLAGLAHVTGKNVQSLELFRKINVEGTRKLVSEAAGRGVKRFVFVSTVKVHGEKSCSTGDGFIQPFTEKDTPAPQGPYAISKLEAEQVIKNMCSKTRMQYIILRPPLIYGPHVKANFLRLVDLTAKGIPSPLASINNRRSLLYVDNLAVALLTAIEKPEVTNNTYLVSDTDVSLPQLIKEIAKHLGKKTTLYPFPVSLLRVAGILTGRKDAIERLTESLLVDSNKIRNDLQWEPKVTFEEGIKNTIEWYKNQ
jgi:nucleoside-diphosphate-sugar epimerase